MYYGWKEMRTICSYGLKNNLQLIKGMFLQAKIETLIGVFETLVSFQRSTVKITSNALPDIFPDIHVI